MKNFNEFIIEELNIKTYKSASNKLMKKGHQIRSKNIDNFISSKINIDDKTNPEEKTFKSLMGELQLQLKNGETVTIKPENIKIFTTSQTYNSDKVFIVLYFDVPSDKINLSKKYPSIKIILPNGEYSRVVPKVTTGSPKMDKLNMNELPSDRKEAIKLYKYLIKLSKIINKFKEIIISKSYDASKYQRDNAVKTIKELNKHIKINDLYTK